MKTACKISLALCLLGIMILIFNVHLAMSEPKVWTVDDDGPADFHTIQEAINAAMEGDTISVSAGNYNESVVVNKTLTLMGAGESVTFINGTTAQPTVTVSVSNVNIVGFTIRGGAKGILLFGSHTNTISNNTITSNAVQGVEIESSHNNIITGNTISSNGYAGVIVQNSANDLINHNVITKNRYVAIGLISSSNTRVSNNTISFHEDRSVHTQGVWLASSNSSTITGNMIFNNAWAVDTYSSSNNIVYENIISNNYQGVALESSNNNFFYHNNFVNNTNWVDSYMSSNTWDDGYPSGGNHWSNYKERYPDAKQLDNLGIWDTPYSIDGDNDRYPLMERWRPSVDLTAPVTTNDYDGLWRTQDFTIRLAAEDFSGVEATYYKINNSPTISEVSANGQPFITRESANNTLEYWSSDYADNNETHHFLTGIKLDKTIPSGSILINNGDAYTTSRSVKLSLSASDALSGVSQMRFSRDGSVWFALEIYTTVKNWSLTAGDGLKTVYVQYRDKAGLLSQSYNDAIILDTTPPRVSILSPSNDSEVKSPDLTIQWNGTDSGSGIDYYEVRLDSDSWINVEMEQNYTFTGLIDGRHEIDVKATDKLGHSQECSVSFLVNANPAEGYGYTREAAIVLILAVTLGIVALYFYKFRKRS